MDTFAALALATDPADPAALNRKPDRKTSPLISAQMWMMILGESPLATLVRIVLSLTRFINMCRSSCLPDHRRARPALCRPQDFQLQLDRQWNPYRPGQRAEVAHLQLVRVLSDL